MISKMYEYCNCYKFQHSLVADCYDSYEDAVKNIDKNASAFGNGQLVIINKYWPIILKKQIFNYKFAVPVFYRENY